MGVIFRLAIRNLSEHKSKTIIIALFLIFGIAIVVLGNSFLESVNRGLEKDFRANYTGDIVVSALPQKGDIIDLFAVTSTNISGEIPQIPAIQDLDKVEKIVEEYKSIERTTKQISAQVLITKGLEFDMTDLDDDLGLADLPVACLFAGDTDSYWDVFPDLDLIEGSYPQKGTNEVIIDSRIKRNVEKTFHQTINIGDTILILGANTNGVIREAKVTGIFKPADENTAMIQILYCDPDLARAFADLTYANTFEDIIPDSIDLSISSMDEDDLFGLESEDDFFSDMVEEDLSVLREDTSDFTDILGDTSLRDELNKTDVGAWNFIIAKLDRPAKADELVQELNMRFKEEGLSVQAMNWEQAAFSYSASVEGISFIFNLLIIILAIVVFIIIMNTMTVSVIERTSEIGTMRAIGAEKTFVKKLFYIETLTLTSVSSFIGIILAFIIMAIFNSLEITITNEIAKMILGGGLLHFSPTIKIILVTIIIALAGSLLSNVYPVKSALRITPLKALSKGE